MEISDEVLIIFNFKWAVPVAVVINHACEYEIRI
jgi:hypothetical protein